MLLAGVVLALICRGASAAGLQPSVWRNYQEVFDLAAVGGQIVAVTNGGLLTSSARGWVPIPSPGGLREVVSLQPFVVRTAGGNEVTIPLVGDPAKDRFGEHPAAGAGPHVYSTLSYGGVTYEGTSEGLYELSGGSSVSQNLPSTLPVTRPNGIAKVGDTYAVGGLGGLYLGQPGNWRQVTPAAIRQVFAWKGQFWVVHGDGALDRIDPSTDRIYPDFLVGAAPRAWISCIGLSGDTLLFGSQGGWCERDKNLEARYPPELKSDVVLALAGKGTTRWIATEQSGVVRFVGDRAHPFNPGNGLADTWVTSLLKASDGLWVGTMHAGLFLVKGDSVRPVKTPTQRVTAIALFGRRLFVGGMDGAWVREGSSWNALPTHGEETTSISEVGGRPVVTTASGVYFF